MIYKSSNNMTDGFLENIFSFLLDKGKGYLPIP